MNSSPSQKGNVAPAMLGHVRGTIEAYPAPLARVNWAVNYAMARTGGTGWMSTECSAT